MEIELQAPYLGLWLKATLRMCEDGRRRVTLWNGSVRMGTTYARYLMSVKLGRFLTEEEHVDHKDEDKSNDDIDNLQILTPLQNVQKNIEFKSRQRKDAGLDVIVTVDCEGCGKPFEKPLRNVRYAKAKGQSQTCSRKCKALVSPPPPKPKLVISDELQKQLRDLRLAGNSDYTMATILGISRPTIQRYRLSLGIE